MKMLVKQQLPGSGATESHLTLQFFAHVGHKTGSLWDTEGQR